MVPDAKQLNELELAHIIELVPTADLMRDAEIVKDMNSEVRSLKASFARFLDGMNDWPELTLIDKDDITGEETWGPRGFGGWLHVSQMPYFCERKETLLRLYPELGQRVDAKLRGIFGIGTVIHRLFQESYFGRMRILHGTWRCRRCGYSVVGFMPRDQCDCSRACIEKCIWPTGYGANDRDCVKCPKVVSWQYVEKEVRSESLRLRGHYDGELRFGKQRVLLEIKTMNTNQFKFLRAPVPKQVLQARIYMRLDGFERGLMVYIDKGGQEFPKFYPIGPDIQQTGELFFRIKEFWEHFDEAKRTGKVFPRVLCEAKNKGLANSCPCADLCFDPSIDVRHGVLDVED